jgi:regulator of sigma E protease
MVTVLSFLIVIGILIFAHELGHFLAARSVGVGVVKFSLGFGPKLIGKQVGETEYLISAVPLGGYVKLLGDEPEEAAVQPPADAARSFFHQPLWKRSTIVAAGPVFNLFLAYLTFTVFLAIGMAMYIPQFETIEPVVETVIENSPAEKGGLKPGDRVVAIEGREISTWTQMTEIVLQSAGKTLRMEVVRDGARKTLLITPDPKTIQDDQGKEITVGQIGVAKSGKGTAVEAENILDALVKGAVATYRWTELTVVGLFKIASGGLSMDNIGGPLLIAQMSGQAAQQGVVELATLIAILSISLGVLNLLPIPVLDGGHLLFFAIEAVMGRPLSVKHREKAQYLGLALLIGLMILAFYNDLIRIFMPSGG